MKKVLLYSLLALFTILNTATGRAFQARKTSPAKTPRTAAKPAVPCVGKSGEKLPNKDAQINSMIARINEFTTELVRRANFAANPSAGVDAAQRYMNLQKNGVRALFIAATNVQECQVSEQIREYMKTSFYQDGVKIGKLTAKYGYDPAVRLKLKKLTEDFLSIFQLEGEPLHATDSDTHNTPSLAETKDPCAGKPVVNNPARDADIKNFVATINAFTQELVQKVESAPSPSAGVDEAQRHIDKEKARLRAAFNNIQFIEQCAVSYELREMVRDNFYQDGVMIGKLTAKYGSDPEVKAKLKKLTDDYLALFAK